MESVGFAADAAEARFDIVSRFDFQLYINYTIRPFGKHGAAVNVCAHEYL